MQSEDRWVIDIEWLEANNRSFSVMATESLCPKCRKKLKVDHTEPQPADILKPIKTCCSKSDEFITSASPLQESIFRALLGNGNKPLTPEEISQNLRIKRGADVHGGSAVLLARLLENGRHYGFKAV